MESNIRKLRNDIEFLPYKFNITLADLREYQRNKPLVDKKMNSINEDLKIKDIRIKLLEDEVGKLKFQVQKKDNTIDKLSNLLLNSGQKEDELDGLEYNERDYLVDHSCKWRKKNTSYPFRNNNEEPDSN